MMIKNNSMNDLIGFSCFSTQPLLTSDKELEKFKFQNNPTVNIVGDIQLDTKPEEPKSMVIPDMEYRPSDFGIVNTYREIETIYDERLASSTVWTVKRLEDNESPLPRDCETLLIKKSICKSKLFGEDQLHHARQECAIQRIFDHKNIVKLHEYAENDDEIVIFMEHINDPEYFERKLEHRHKEIKNEDKLRQYATDVLEGLKEIHNTNIIHADMKLPNILLQRPTTEEK